jgi:hypothetical protein
MPDHGTQHAHVTRPADLAAVSMRELLDARQRHIAQLANARHALSVARLARHALDALATGQALTDQMTATRWVIAADALAHGALLDHVADAMGLETDEVATGLCSWATGQRRQGRMAPAEHDAVHELLDAQGAAL